MLATQSSITLALGMLSISSTDNMCIYLICKEKKRSTVVCLPTFMYSIQYTYQIIPVYIYICIYIYIYIYIRYLLPTLYMQTMKQTPFKISPKTQNAIWYFYVKHIILSNILNIYIYTCVCVRRPAGANKFCFSLYAWQTLAKTLSAHGNEKRLIVRLIVSIRFKNDMI